MEERLKLFAFTLDLEADYGGLGDRYSILKDLDKVDALLSALTALGVKLTIFTVAEIFELYPEVIKLFEKHYCEFEPHSYSHNFNCPDSEEEIKKAKDIFSGYFGKDPIGYRAPRGMISDSGIRTLEKHGILYDSSIFPSYFPNPFKYLFCNRNVHYYKDSNVMEIPFTSLSPFRLSLSISYIKLLGLGFYKTLSLPDIVCFGSHLHDFIINQCSFDKLSPVWQLIYSRNKFKGTDICLKYLDYVREKDYRFCYMSEIYNAHRK